MPPLSLVSEEEGTIPTMLPWPHHVTPDQQEVVLNFGVVALARFPDSFTSKDVDRFLYDLEKKDGLPEPAWIQSTRVPGYWLAVYDKADSVMTAWGGIRWVDREHRGARFCVVASLFGRVADIHLSDSIALDLPIDRRRFRHRCFNPALPHHFAPAKYLLDIEVNQVPPASNPQPSPCNLNLDRGDQSSAAGVTQGGSSVGADEGVAQIVPETAQDEVPSKLEGMEEMEGDLSPPAELGCDELASPLDPSGAFEEPEDQLMSSVLTESDKGRPTSEGPTFGPSAEGGAAVEADKEPEEAQASNEVIEEKMEVEVDPLADHLEDVYAEPEAVAEVKTLPLPLADSSPKSPRIFDQLQEEFTSDSAPRTSARDAQEANPESPSPSSPPPQPTPSISRTAPLVLSIRRSAPRTTSVAPSPTPAPSRPEEPVGRAEESRGGESTPTSLGDLSMPVPLFERIGGSKRRARCQPPQGDSVGAPRLADRIEGLGASAGGEGEMEGRILGVGEKSGNAGGRKKKGGRRKGRS